MTETQAHPIFTKAAAELIDKIEKPEYFLRFLTLMLVRAHTHIVDKKVVDTGSGYYMLTRIIDYVFFPLLSTNKQPAGLAGGLRELYELDFSSGISDIVNLLLDTMEHVEKEEYFEDAFFYINVLRQLENRFAEYEKLDFAK